MFFTTGKGGEIYVKKIPSMTIVNIDKAVSETATQKVIGIRPGKRFMSR